MTATELSPLEEYLKYYLSLDKPRFAVLVTGAWGTGKTYQVSQALKIINANREYPEDPLKPDHPIFVSLYGVTSPEELDAAIVAASDTFTHLGLGGLRTIGTISNGIGGIFAAGAVANMLIGPAMRRSMQENSHRLIVLDDFERCTIDLDNRLGIVNAYVEQMGFKVVIIAHDEKITEEINEKKEKMIGQTIRVKPQFNNAFKVFSEELTDASGQKLIESLEPVFLEVFRKADLSSLRILRHVISDFVRFTDCLTVEQRGHIETLDFLARNFIVIDALVREGVFSRNDFANFSERCRAHDYKIVDSNNDDPSDENEDSVDSTFEIGIARIQQADCLTYQIPFPDKLILAMFVDGLYDKQQIQTWLADSGFFGGKLEARSWWRVWHRRSRPDQQVLEDIQAMERDFKERTFIDVQDILHLFGLRLSLANETLLLQISVPEVISECESYISDLLKTGKLEPAQRLGRNDSLDSWAGAYGLGYAGAENRAISLEFNNLFKKLNLARQTALVQSFPSAIKRIMSLLAENSKDSIAEISRLLTDPDGDYVKIPIFKDEDPQDFFEAMAKLDGSFIYNLRIILGTRYYGVQLHNGLDPEIDWILGLLQVTSTGAEDELMTPVTRSQLRFFHETFERVDIDRRKAELTPIEGA